MITQEGCKDQENVTGVQHGKETQSRNCSLYVPLERTAVTVAVWTSVQSPERVMTIAWFKKCASFQLSKSMPGSYPVVRGTAD